MFYDKLHDLHAVGLYSKGGGCDKVLYLLKSTVSILIKITAHFFWPLWIFQRLMID